MIKRSKPFLLVGVFSLTIATSLLGACNAAEQGAAASVAQSAQVGLYQTQLFSLLMNSKSPVDGKNHYQKDFEQRFDALLAQSALARAAKPGVSLKKRLLSGPQPEPMVLRSPQGPYVYYEACQAHACDETSLALLYAPATKAMLGRLHLDGKDEYLGNPSAAEKALLDQAKNHP